MRHQKSKLKQKKSVVQVMIRLVSILLLAGVLPMYPAKASSCNVTLSMDETEVSVDESFIMTITMEATELIRDVEMTLTYDPDALYFVTGSPAISGGDGTLKLSDLDISSTNKVLRYVVKFQVQKAGVSYVKIAPNPSIYNDTDGQPMPIASNVLTVDSQASEQQSDNTALKSLKISGGTLQEEFSKELMEYNVTVDSKITSLIISATPEDPLAKVKVEGADHLTEGENEIHVIVEAENGDTKTYIIYAICEEESKKEQEESTPEDASTEEIIEETQVPQAITAKQDGENVFLTTYGTFQMEELPEELEIPNGYIETTILIDGILVTGYQETEGNSEFVLLYAKREGTDATFYQYDITEQTLQRFHPSLQVSEPTIPENVTDSTQNGKHYNLYLFLGLVILCILFMGTTAILLRKRRS